MPEGIEPLEEIADAEGAGLPTHGGPHLGARRLTLRHAVAQSLALGPIISAGRLLGLIQVLNCFGIRVATRAMLAFAVVALIPMLILAVAIIAKGGANGNTLAVFNPSTTSLSAALDGILIGVTLFVGFEASAALGEE